MPVLFFVAVVLLTFLQQGAAFGLGSDAMQAMVIVEGDDGHGSAFLVRMGGKVYLVTNSHVVCGNRNVKFKSMNNQELKTGPLQIADSADLVRAEVANASSALEFLPQIEQQLKIGDAIAVVGNSEGGGVVREILGKSVGIGPDRIEVDAPFVSGNSGSPILLQSTGQVVGVATYLTVPPAIPADLRGQNPGPPATVTSLNQIRRFGYRLDSVSKWVTPTQPDGIVKQGTKLIQIEDLTSAVIFILDAGMDRLLALSQDGILKHKEVGSDPNLLALIKAVDDFCEKYRSTHDFEDRKKLEADLYASMKLATEKDVHDLKPEQFSGFYAMQYHDEIERRKLVGEFLESLSTRTSRDLAQMTAAREKREAQERESREARERQLENERQRVAQIAQRHAATPKPANAASPQPKIAKEPDPPVNAATTRLVLSDQVDPKKPLTRQHFVSFPLETKPANAKDTYWIVKDPANRYYWVAVGDSSTFNIATPINGKYQVYLEYWKRTKKKKSEKIDKSVISNVLDISVSGVPGQLDPSAAASTAPSPAPATATPAAPAAN